MLTATYENARNYPQCQFVYANLLLCTYWGKWLDFRALSVTAYKLYRNNCVLTDLLYLIFIISRQILLHYTKFASVHSCVKSYSFAIFYISIKIEYQLWYTLYEAGNTELFSTLLNDNWEILHLSSNRKVFFNAVLLIINFSNLIRLFVTFYFLNNRFWKNVFNKYSSIYNEI